MSDLAPDHEASVLIDQQGIDDAQMVRSAGLRTEALETAPQAITVLNLDDLTDTPATTLPDRLRYVAGIDVYQSRAGQYDVGLRGYDGLNNSRIVAVLDGQEFRSEPFGTVLWIGVINQSDIRQVEIAKGPSSVTYGANAFGGVIDIETREPDDVDRFYTLDTIGSDDAREVDVTALGPLGAGFDYKVGAGGTWLDALPGPVGMTSYTPSPRTANSGNIDMIALRAEGQVGYDFLDGYRLEAGYHGTSIPDWVFVEDLKDGDNLTSWTINDADVRMTAPWGSFSQSREYEYITYSNEKGVYVQPDFNYAQAGFHNVSDTSQAQLNIEGGDHQLSIGGEFFRWQSLSNLWATNASYADHSTWSRVETVNRALFGEDRWAFAPMWVATGGVRVDDHSLVGTNISPRLAFNYVPEPDEFWLFSLSSGYRLPSAIESYLQDYYFGSNPDLRPESIRAVELGWQRKLWQRDLSLSWNLFYNESNDQIWILPLSSAVMAQNFNTWANLPPAQQNTTQPGPYFHFANLDDPVDVIGLETSQRYHLPQTPLSLWCNETFTYYRYRHDVVYQSNGFNSPFGVQFAFNQDLGRVVNAPPRWKFNIGMDYRQGPIFATIATRYVSHRQVFSFANSDFPVGQVATEDLPAYMALDLSLGWDFGVEKRNARFIRFSVMDLFNNSHFEAYHASSSDLIANNDQQYVSEIGRTFALQAGWDF